jgi:hypothetical protein
MIYNSQAHHTKVRLEICSFISAHHTLFNALAFTLTTGLVTLDEYLLAKNKVANSAADVDQYGDEIMLLALALYYRRRIIIYTPSIPAQNGYQVTVFSPTSIDINKQVIYLHHKNNNHYEILIDTHQPHVQANQSQIAII